MEKIGSPGNRRQACAALIVVVSYGGANPGFVVAGRSLREVETRENALSLETIFAWIAALLSTLILVIGFEIAAARMEHTK